MAIFCPRTSADDERLFEEIKAKYPEAVERNNVTPDTIALWRGIMYSKPDT